MKKIICYGLYLLCLIGVMLPIQAFSEQNFTELKAGDLLTLPIEKGNFVMLLYGGGDPLWYDGQQEWFGYMPIRNYGTVYVDITRRTPPGDYQFIEIDATSNPMELRNWRYLKASNFKITQCDGFKIC